MCGSVLDLFTRSINFLASNHFLWLSSFMDHPLSPFFSFSDLRCVFKDCSAMRFQCLLRFQVLIYPFLLEHEWENPCVSSLIFSIVIIILEIFIDHYLSVFLVGDHWFLKGGVLGFASVKIEMTLRPW